MTSDLFEIKKELVMELRNWDVISISNRGVTTKTDTGTFAAAGTFTPSTSPTLIKNVRSVTVAAVTLTYGTDYTINHDTGVITFTAAQTGAYTIIYDYGNTDSIFPDFPQANLKLSAFPRIAVDIMGGNRKVIDLGAITDHATFNLTIVCYSTDVEQLEDMISSIISNMKSNRKSLYTLKFIGNAVLGPIINSPGSGDKVVQRNIDFETMFNYE